MGLALKSFILTLTVAGGPTAGAPLPSPTPKSFAVFSVAYKARGGEVRGGVGGTAFFVSPTTVITAYHVLQPATFQAAAGEKKRTWLVRENFRPVELKPQYLT